MPINAHFRAFYAHFMLSYMLQQNQLRRAYAGYITGLVYGVSATELSAGKVVVAVR